MRFQYFHGEIIGAAIEVHRSLGPGLLEAIYETCLIRELSLKKLKVETRKHYPFIIRAIN